MRFIEGVPTSSSGSQPRSSVTEAEQYFHTACRPQENISTIDSKWVHKNLHPPKSRQCQLLIKKQVRSNKRGYESRRRCALKDTWGGSFFGITDGDDFDDACRERMREREGKARSISSNYFCWILCLVGGAYTLYPAHTPEFVRFSPELRWSWIYSLTVSRPIIGREQGLGLAWSKKTRQKRLLLARFSYVRFGKHNLSSFSTWLRL